MEGNKQPTFYVADFGAGVYHQPNCLAVSHIPYKIRFESVAEAEADGYVPDICIPSSSTSLSPKTINRLPTSEELKELVDLGWKAVQSGKCAKYQKLIGKGLSILGDLKAEDLKKISHDLTKLGLEAKGKKVLD